MERHVRAGTMTEPGKEKKKKSHSSAADPNIRRYAGNEGEMLQDESRQVHTKVQYSAH